MDDGNGWFNICQRERERASLEVVATACSMGRAEIVRDALMSAYGGKVYERPRQAVGSLARETDID
jgi:hypothetical protein